MTSQRDLERILDAWLGDGPYEASDRVIDQVGDRIAHESQMSPWRVRWGPRNVSAYLDPRQMAAAVAIVALVVVGAVFLPRLTGTAVMPTLSPTATPHAALPPSATSSPTATPSPSWTPSVYATPQPPAVSLTAGTHASTVEGRRVTFTVPDGWRMAADETGLRLTSAGRLPWAPPRAYVYTVGDVHQPCVELGPDDPHAASDLVEYFTAGSDVVATPVNLSGIRGWKVEGQSFGQEPLVDPLIACFGWLGWRSAFPTLATQPGGGTGVESSVLVLEWTPDAALVIAWSGEDAEALAEAEAVLDSFEFGGEVSPTLAPTEEDCQIPSPAPSVPPPSDDEAGVEHTLLVDGRGMTRLLVVVTNQAEEWWPVGLVVVNVFDACGDVRSIAVSVQRNLAPHQSTAILTEIDFGSFVPVRSEVDRVTNVLAPGGGHTPYDSLGRCGRNPDSGGDATTGPIVRGVWYASGARVDVYFDAIAVYRDASGAIVGADVTEVEHLWNKRGDTTSFEVPQARPMPEAESVRLYCVVTDAR